jgi:hypothetical protein
MYRSSGRYSKVAEQFSPCGPCSGRTIPSVVAEDLVWNYVAEIIRNPGPHLDSLRRTV